MATFYVFDRVMFGPDSASIDPTDRLTKSSSGGFMIESSSLCIKRFLTVFDEYEPAEVYFTRLSNPPGDYMHRLWKVSAWTESGAAKKCMKSNGVVVRLAKRSDDSNQALIGEILLRTMEQTDLPIEEISKLHKDLKDAFIR